jgi:hypothetical protein
MLAIVVAVALGAAPAAAARAGDTFSDGRFRLEWEVATSRKGPRLEGYLHNLMLRPGRTRWCWSSRSTTPVRP